MDFNLKHWREESEEDEHQTSTKLPRLDSSSPAPALPLFLPQPQSNHHYYSTSSTKLLTTRIGMGMGMGGGGSYFSWAQWQELQLQALIFSHIMGGGGVPAELLYLVNKSLVSSPLHYYHPSSSSSLAVGYWGAKGGMDPEPGRCRRTDGKKWRCSRDVVASQKYCHRHMHRGKNRSRKPVVPTPFTLSHPRPETQPAGDPTLRHFFDTSLDDHAPHSATNQSISLKLGSDGGSTPQINWDGPLAEALSSSASPMTTLHSLHTTSASHTSFLTS